MKRMLLLALLLLGVAAACAEPETLAFRLNEQGTQAYLAERYDDAFSLYRQAQVARPDFPELNINAGSALYKQEAYDRAIREFRRALNAWDGRLKASSHFGLGNTLYRMDQPREALEEYKWALRLDPNDADAKHNLEVVLRELSRTAPPTLGDNPQPDREAEPQQGDGGDPGGGDGQADPGSGTAGPPQGPVDSSAQSDALRRMLQEAPADLAIEDAIRILDALQERQQAIQARWNRGSGGRGAAMERDW